MNSRTTINSANDFAHNYDDYVKNCQWVGADILFGLMYEYINLNQTFLDIGIGTGLSSKIFKQYGLIIYGIDGAEEMIKICQNKGIAEELRQVDLTKDDVWFENRTFDHVVSHGVFHLIEDLNYIFKQTSKVLNKNGCFGFTYEELRNQADDYKESSTVGIYQRQNKQSGVNSYRHTENYIIEQIYKNGFELLKKTEFLAFVDSKTKIKIYFNAIIVKKNEIINKIQLFNITNSSFNALHWHKSKYRTKRFIKY